ncbi:MAG TPA: hypothetical protein VJH22_07280 [Candidatus Nanoarchaeia archaeon]|nr:hypothetical protein [Candidatus Nanoarchaeia archaeon]
MSEDNLFAREIFPYESLTRMITGSCDAPTNYQSPAKRGIDTDSLNAKPITGLDHAVIVASKGDEDGI